MSGRYFPSADYHTPTAQKKRGWALQDIAVKCRTLLLSRLWTLSTRKESVTAGWMHKWNLTNTLANPPHGNQIPTKFAYVRHYAIDMTYLTPPYNTEPLKKFKQKIYGVLQKMANADSEATGIRIIRKHPSIPWERVWTNLHKTWSSDKTKSTWYAVIHEIVPTNESLAGIRAADTDRCTHCGKTDTLKYRITDCGEGPVLWNLTRARIAALLRVNPHYIPAEWTLRPTFHIWPPRNKQQYYGYSHTWWNIAHKIRGASLS